MDYPSQNVERVYIEDQYWQYNEYRIPEPEPEPEPPYGVEWLGDLQDYMTIENFQIAGMVMLLTIIINFVGLPLILKKRKRMKRVIAKRAANAPSDLDDEFQDFFNLEYRPSVLSQKAKWAVFLRRCIALSHCVGLLIRWVFPRGSNPPRRASIQNHSISKNS